VTGDVFRAALESGRGTSSGDVYAGYSRSCGLRHSAGIGPIGNGRGVQVDCLVSPRQPVPADVPSRGPERDGRPHPGNESHRRSKAAKEQPVAKNPMRRAQERDRHHPRGSVWTRYLRLAPLPMGRSQHHGSSTSHTCGFGARRPHRRCRRTAKRHPYGQDRQRAQRGLGIPQGRSGQTTAPCLR